MANTRGISVPLRFLALALALTSGVSACGGDDEPSATPSSEATSASESPSPAVDKPVAVGPWKVEVVEIEADGTDTVMSANKFNKLPKGTYVLAVVEAAYAGKKKRADAVFDLTWTFTDVDGKVYENEFALGPNNDGPTKAAPGDTVTVDVTFDVPAGTAEGGTLTVEALGKKAVITKDFPVEG